MIHETEINYYLYLPESLHQEADRLIHYLKHFPFETPECCPKCGHKSFRVDNRASKRDKTIKNYRCKSCDGGFNRLYGTPLARCRQEFIPLWPHIAAYRLSGMTTAKISERLNISIAGVYHRDNVIAEIMRVDYPALYAWWFPRQQREFVELPKKVSQQCEQFKAWLHELEFSQTADCSECGQSCYRIHARPQFYCTGCQQGFNLLANTPLRKHYHMPLWSSYVDCLVRGDTISDIQRQLGVQMLLLNRWRDSFALTMKQQGYEELVAWIAWQRSRRHVQINKQTMNNFYTRKRSEDTRN
ncbi:IS1 family transposase [Serratia sp. ASV30]|uniref:IS1 family transposase n=1 Tax=Serratia sp. ASV30 TaxID=2795127 RepID=UPI0018ED3C72|nr:IS1 family transposase [Serratia sp. ASV30]